MKRILSVFFGLLLASSSLAHAGLFDAVKSMIPGEGDKNAAAVPAGDAKPGAATGQADAGNFDLEADPAFLTDKFVEVENADKLNGITRVVIPSFMVEFVTEAKADAQINGIAMISGAPSNTVVRLKGGDPTMFQGIVDKLYDQTVADLHKAGIEIVSQDELAKSATYKEIADKSQQAPREEEAKGGKGIYHSAKGLPLYYMDEAGFIPKFQIKLFAGKPKEDIFLTFGTKFSSGFSAAQIPQLEEKLAKEFDATVMKVRITFLAGAAQVENSFWTGNTASVKGAGAFAPFVNRYAFIRENGDKARISLKETVVTSGLGDLVNVTSTASKVGDVARNAFTVGSRLASAFAGGPAIDLGYGNSADYEWRVESGQFENSVQRYYPGISGMFIAKLRPPAAAQKVSSAN